MKKIKKFKIKNYSNRTGNLIPFTFGKNFPINVKRIFFIYGKKNKIRGNHAHKKCSQFFVPIYGKIILEIKTPKIKKKINLNYSLKTGVLVPPKYWCSIRFVTKNAILMVACDLNYNSNDYLSNFDKYKKYLKK
tara:strand:- start:848 stop:1249 length:402 start_codon:yes stop_codon:yes gene_type:complete